MRYHNTVTQVSNYATEELNKMLNRYGQLGYQFVNATMAKNQYGVDVMYLFFTKPIEDGKDDV